MSGEPARVSAVACPDPVALVRAELDRFEQFVHGLDLADHDAAEISNRLAVLAEGLTRAGRQRAGTGPAVLSLLSPRELQVARLITKGYTNQQIARLLEVRVNTVQVHVGHVLRKLGVPSRSAVTRIMTLAEAGPYSAPARAAR